MTPVTRFATFLLLGALAAAHPQQDGSADPVFSQIPFEQWLAQGDQSHMHWTARLSESELSAHQRLVAQVSVEVDGAELARRRGKGQFLVLVQVNDEKGHVWQNHQQIDLEHIDEGIKSNDALFSQLLFVVPGDYRVSIGIFADATGEHGVIRRKLHVSPLKNDPVPGAWAGLPAVEFVSPSNPPDSWFLPSAEGKLRLAVEAHEPVRVNLVVNLTPAEQFTGSARVQNRNFGVLLPTAKVLSQVDWRNVTFSLALLDLSRRRVTYQQEGAGGLDWSKASGALTEVNPGIIDVKSLEKRQYSAQFFLDEIRRRIRRGPASGGSRVVIVLSSGVQFVTAQELRTATIDSPSDARVFYIRYQPPPQIYFGPAGRQRVRQPIARDGIAGIDQLEPLLKPLEPRLFDVDTPEQFRKAIATILAEIAKL